jgi:hypothetical protein
MANHPQITDDVLDELELVLVDDLDLSVRIRNVAELADGARAAVNPRPPPSEERACRSDLAQIAGTA